MLYNEELKLKSSQNIIRMIKLRRMRWAEYLRVWGEEECIQGFDGNARRKKTTTKGKRKWENNNKMDLREKGLGGMEYIDLVQYREKWIIFVRTVLNLLGA
jgi:hypothetical protein